MPTSKTFRSVVCSILAILLLIHTTPLYAAGSGSSGTSSAAASSGTASPADSGSGSIGPAVDPTSGAGGSAQGPSTFLSTGAATYSVPIEVPKGRGGISPNLSLIYNSYQGNGWIGVGWMLDMGAIQRSTTPPFPATMPSGSPLRLHSKTAQPPLSPTTRQITGCRR